jgi:putative Holliday junction resolvase
MITFGKYCKEVSQVSLLSQVLHCRRRDTATAVIDNYPSVSYLTSQYAHLMPRLMAFDYGTKRIGIAVTDPLQIIATGLDTVHPNTIIDYLKKYMFTEPVERFIVGEPKQMDNTPSQSAQHVRGFVNLLKKQFPEIPIEMLDERFTSKMAHAAILASGRNKKDRQDKGLVDTVSAVILLQSWMSKL